MSLITFIKNLPIDLQYIVLNYYPMALFILTRPELAEYDWFQLNKMIFGSMYSREMCSDDEMIKVYIDNSLRNKSKIVCGGDHVYIRLVDGTLMSCGYNWFGQLGIGNNDSQHVFSEIKGIKKNIVEVICGENHTIIRMTDGTLMSCGNNYSGQLGLGDYVCRNVFCEIEGICGVVEVKCVGDYTIIRLTDGTLMGCGNNKKGHLGLGDNLRRNLFVEIKCVPKNIEEVICQESHVIVRLTDGTLMGCGYNEFGQLGFEDNRTTNLFEEIVGIPKNIIEVICGPYHTIIRLTDGTLMSCGFNRFGQLGLGDVKDRKFFSEIASIDKNVVKIICGYAYTIIRLANGSLMSVGNNMFGELGLGDSIHRNIFSEIKGIDKNISEMICSDINTIVRLTDGTLMVSGTNSDGQLGLGDFLMRNEYCETKVIGKSIVEVINGTLFTIIRLNDGTLMSCGYNFHGQLGVGDKLNKSEFTLINGIPKMLSG
ncbi:MAG: chromosome condensation regulator [Hyperionvirus sp.]|uniref:Chromosome condensation regulator n=1 Tax=Hyperionvirus sp. TaxID=2487770 RepID=A0A3G5A7X2_9VIRU|nr:MAG: chromosome condensation regulator [Hyperionvirus sp.]